MRRHKVLFPMIYLVLVVLFLVGCIAPEDTPAPAIIFVTVTPTAPSTDTSEESLAFSAPVAGSTVIAVVAPGEASCDNNLPPTVDAGGPYNAMMGKGYAIVNFDGSNSTDPDGAIKDYVWDFGDDSEPGSGQRVSHAYSNIGIFQAKLTVTDDCGATSQDTAEVMIVGPTPPATGTPTPILLTPTSTPTDTSVPSTLTPTETPVTPTSSPSGPDLVLQSFKVLDYEWRILGGFEATVEVVVQNVGDAPASAFEVGIVGVNREDKYVRFSHDPNLTVGLQAGQEITLIGETGLFWHGNFDVTCADNNYDPTQCALRDENTLWLLAIADYCEGNETPDHCAVAEIDETNNTKGPMIIETPQSLTPTPTETPVTPTPTSTETSITPTPTPTSTETPITPSPTPTLTETPITPTLTPTPLVILMDGDHENHIYNPDPNDPGKTNPDVIAGILASPSSLPIGTRKETTSPQWSEQQVIRDLDPALIIIHASAFRDYDEPIEPNTKFEDFLNFMAATPAKFQIYTRRDHTTCSPAFEGQLKQQYETDYGLHGRVEVLCLPWPRSGECEYWNCAGMRERLRNNVKSLLGLP